MMSKLGELYAHGLTHWKLDGIYCPGDNFVAIAKLFIQAKQLLEAGQFTQEEAEKLDQEVHLHHPAGRGLDTGFYDFDPKTVK